VSVKKKNKSMAGFVVWRRGGGAAAAASCVRSGVSAYSQVPSVARHLHVTMAASAAAAGRSASSISQQEMVIDRQKTAAVLNPKEAPPEKVLLPPDKIGNQKKRSSSSSSSKFLLLGKSEEELQDLAAAHGERKYRGRQLHQLIYKNKAKEIQDCAQLPKLFRDSLETAGWSIGRAPIHHVATSSDGTAKVGCLLLSLSQNFLYSKQKTSRRTDLLMLVGMGAAEVQHRKP
jgi:hypothetical protein